MSKRPKTKQQKLDERNKRKARYGRHWDEIRRRVYERDGYHCRACGRTIPEIRKLNAHHILLLRVSQSNDIRNLITLCDECHKIIESKALVLLKRGGHRFEIVRLTHRWLMECKIKRQETLLEEVNELAISSNFRQDKKNSESDATDTVNASSNQACDPVCPRSDISNDLQKL